MITLIAVIRAFFAPTDTLNAYKIITRGTILVVAHGVVLIKKIIRRCDTGKSQYQYVLKYNVLKAVR